MTPIIIKFKVLGKNWRLRLLSKKDYKKKHGWGSVAVTYMYKRRIDLSPKGLDLETIVHEAVHAFRYEMCVHSCNDVSPDDWEEFFCEMISKRGYEILRLSEDLHFKVRKLIHSTDANP